MKKLLMMCSVITIAMMAQAEAIKISEAAKNAHAAAAAKMASAEGQPAPSKSDRIPGFPRKIRHEIREQAAKQQAAKQAAQAAQVGQQAHAQPAGVNPTPPEPSMSQAERMQKDMKQRHKQEMQQLLDKSKIEYDAAMAGKSSEGFDRFKVQTDFVLKRREALRELHKKHEAELAEFRSKLHGDHPDLSQAKPPELLVDKKEKEHSERPWSPE